MLTRAQSPTRWIRVAGVGKFDLPPEVYWSSLSIGRALACEGYGLVLGGWPGVDYVVADAFDKELRNRGRPLSVYLKQVLPKGAQPQFQGGDPVYIEHGIDGAGQESVRGCDAAVLLGGVGGTFDMYRFAVQEQKPVFPLAGTGGDARRAFEDVLANWPVRPTQCIEQDLFRQVLGQEIRTVQDAEQVTQGLANLLRRYFQARADLEGAKRKSVFISYSQEDRAWREKLRTGLSLLERQRRVKVWDDTAIEAGEEREKAIQEAIRSAQVAVLLVSSHYLASQYFHDKEYLWEHYENKRVKILWVLLSACNYEWTELKTIQAAHDATRPLNSLSESDQNEALAQLVRRIGEALDLE